MRPIVKPYAFVRSPMKFCAGDRKSTRLNSSHVEISYAVFCLKKKKQEIGHRIFFVEVDLFVADGQLLRKEFFGAHVFAALLERRHEKVKRHGRNLASLIFWDF